MPFKEGQSGNPKGRTKGKPNKTTAEIREAYQKLVEDNLTNMTEWLTEVAAENPEKARNLCSS